MQSEFTSKNLDKQCLWNAQQSLEVDSTENNNIPGAMIKNGNLVLKAEKSKELSTIQSEVIYSILSTSVDTNDCVPTSCSLRFKEDGCSKVEGDAGTLADLILDAETENPIPDDLNAGKEESKSKSKKHWFLNWCCGTFRHVKIWERSSGYKYNRIDEE
ncbi:unnamed protein product [Dimorphilus gyrociliatus]|uniref:Uncharacterized protein n=1 Tax=Dimorphilus gyrociliatus TaxID=2664684 RepID=A0A7I8W709_9ANNE|nr:unnamed protein product [Dimorphilus gyrociliatus]